MKPLSLSNSTRNYTQVTCGVSCVVEKGGRYLLVKEHRPGLPDHGTWNLPTGLIDPGESPLEAAQRELKEETGYTGELISFLGVFSLIRDDLIDFYKETPQVMKLAFVLSVSEVTTSIADDVSEVSWFSREELIALTNLRDPDILHMIDRYEHKVSYPIEVVTHSLRTIK